MSVVKNKKQNFTVEKKIIVVIRVIFPDRSVFVDRNISQNVRQTDWLELGLVVSRYY